MQKERVALLDLKKDKRQEIAQYLATEIQIAINSRSTLDQDLEIYNDLYEMKLPPQKSWPWPQASNVFIPITQDKTDSLTARIAYSILKQDPIFIFKGVDAEGEKYAPLLEMYYASKARTLGYRRFLKQAIQLAVRDGTSFIEINRKREMEESVQFGYNPDGELALRKDPVITFDDDVLEAHRLKDVYLIPAYPESVDKAFGIARRFWLRPDEAKNEVSFKRFYPEIEKIPSPGISEKLGYIGSGNEDTTQGQISIIDHESENIGPFECFSITIRYDIDNDGYLEWCRFLLAYNQKVLLAAEEYPYRHRKLNYVSFSPMPRAKSPYGISLVGRLENIQREVNADRNQRRDAITLANIPPLKRLANSPTKLENKPWGPGQVYDVHTMDDMMPIQIQDVPSSTFAEENSMLWLADKLSFTPTFPIQKEATAKEVSATQGDAVLKFDLVMEDIMESMAEIGRQLFFLDRQYIEQNGYDFNYEVNGKYVKLTVPPEAFQFEYDIQANGNFVTFDKERRRQDFLLLYDLLLRSPLLMGIPQGGIPPNFQGIYNLTRRLLQEWDIKDTDSIIGKEDQYIANNQPAEQQGPGGLAGPGVPGSLPGANGGVQGLPQILSNPALLSSLGGGSLPANAGGNPFTG